jgi:hypothetical protein
MANDNVKPQQQQVTPAVSDRVKKAAFELFKASAFGVSPKMLAIRCYRAAQEFCDAEDEILNGTVSISVIDNNPMDDAFAPNLKKTHPVNLISKKWGDLKKAMEAWQHVKNLSVNAYEPYGWEMPECNTARALFPSVIKRAREVGMLPAETN